MSPSETPAPPVGEELHLPGPSLQPALIAVSLVMLLLGLVEMWPVALLGVLLLVAASVSWIRAARRELLELPPGH